MNNKGQFSLLQGAVLSFVVIGILGAVGADILSDVQADQTAGTVAFNATANALEGNSDLMAKLPLIATVVGAVVILAFVFLITRRT